MTSRVPTCILVVAILQSLAGSAHAAVNRSPVPVESLPAWVARYQAAVDALRAGDCARFNQLNVRGTLNLRCDAQTRRLSTSFRVLGYRQFGTGAIVDTIDVSRQTNRAGIYTAILALGPAASSIPWARAGSAP